MDSHAYPLGDCDFGACLWGDCSFHYAAYYSRGKEADKTMKKLKLFLLGIILFLLGVITAQSLPLVALISLVSSLVITLGVTIWPLLTIIAERLRKRG
jgi:hypothetical protein